MDIYWTLFGIHVFAGYCRSIGMVFFRYKHKRELQSDITRLINEFDSNMDVDPVPIPRNLDRTASILVLLDRIFYSPYRAFILNNKIMSMIQSSKEEPAKKKCDPELESLRSEAIRMYKGQKTDKGDLDLLLGKDMKQLKEHLEMLHDLEKLKQLLSALPSQSPRQENKLRILEEMADLKCKIDACETNPPSMKFKDLDYLEVCLHNLTTFQQLTYLKTSISKMIAEEESEKDKVRGLEEYLKNVNSLERLKIMLLVDQEIPAKIKNIRDLYTFKFSDLYKLPPEYATHTGMDIIKQLVKQAREDRKGVVFHELMNGDANLQAEKTRLPLIDPSKLSQAQNETLTLSQGDFVVSSVRTDELVAN